MLILINQIGIIKAEKITRKKEKMGEKMKEKEEKKIIKIRLINVVFLLFLIFILIIGINSNKSKLCCTN